MTSFILSISFINDISREQSLDTEPSAIQMTLIGVSTTACSNIFSSMYFIRTLTARTFGREVLQFPHQSVSDGFFRHVFLGNAGLPISPVSDIQESF